MIHGETDRKAAWQVLSRLAASLCAAMLCATMLAFALLAPSEAQAQSTSPGPLASSHRKWDNRCATCHEPGKGATDQRCLECHKKAKQSRYHWKVAQKSKKKCSQCHRDHQGRGFRMIRWHPPRDFDHGLTGWKLQGTHTKQDCKRCHTKPGRYMGLGKACVNCHKNPHRPTLGPDCTKCHSQKRFAPAPNFSHDRAKFKLRGRHRDVQCAKCHGKAGADGRGANGGGAKAQYRGLSFRSCVSCHADPTPNHSRGKACEGCHTEATWRQSRRGAGLRLHELLPFKLTHKHGQVACASCHKARQKKAKTPVARLQAFQGLRGSCAACHKDPHGKRFGSRCANCHTPASWRAQPKRGAFNHARTGFALVGRHRSVDCSRCHKRSGSYKKQYGHLPHKRCVDCHADPHKGSFQTVADSQRCEACHTVAGFRPAKFGFQRHDKARSKLTGAHRAVACQGCHTPTRPAKERRRKGQRKRRVQARGPSHVARLVGTPEACVACHKRPHGDQFDGRKPSLTCTSCHDRRSFQPASGFDHNKTAFKLAGHHATLACGACHKRPKPRQPVRYAKTAGGCINCHKSPHGDQFDARKPALNCTDCHDNRSFHPASRFDHNKTDFALRGPHAKADCKDCHRKPQADQPVRFARTAQTCAECHRDPHAGQFKDAKAGPVRGCGDCHQVVAGFHIKRFDHNKTRFPLRGQHAKADCKRCHQPVRVGSKTVTHYRLGNLACARCHRNPHSNPQTQLDRGGRQ